MGGRIDRIHESCDSNKQQQQYLFCALCGLALLFPGLREDREPGNARPPECIIIRWIVVCGEEAREEGRLNAVCEIENGSRHRNSV